MIRFWRWLTRPVVAVFTPAGASATRDVFALLVTPVLTVLACWLIWSFMFGPWSRESETLRLTVLGFTLGGYVVLMGLGGLWLQRRGVNRIRVDGPGDTSVEIDAGADAAAGDTPSIVTTASKMEVKP